AFDQVMWELVRDLEVAGGLLAELSDHSTRYWRLVEAIDRALDSFDDADPDSAATARHQLKDVLDAPAHATAADVSDVGQAHMHTSTPRGCGRCGKPAERSPAPSPTSWPWWTRTRSSSMQCRRPSSSPGSNRTSLSSSRRSSSGSLKAASSRSAECGSNRMR